MSQRKCSTCRHYALAKSDPQCQPCDVNNDLKNWEPILTPSQLKANLRKLRWQLVWLTAKAVGNIVVGLLKVLLCVGVLLGKIPWGTAWPLMALFYIMEIFWKVRNIEKMLKEKK